METYVHLGQIAGIAGITIGLVSTIFSLILKRRILPTLSSDQAFKILRLIVIFSFLIGVMGLGAWTYLEMVDYLNIFDESDYHILSGDLNEDFDDKNLNNILKKININLNKNKDKLITFPYDNRQLDYILTNIVNPKYSVIETNLSDHNILILDIKI